MKISLGFAPAPDGGVMFYGLSSGKIDTRGLQIQPVLMDLPALNDRASRGELEATMVSAAAWPYLRERYALARCGACFAHGRGPVLAVGDLLEGGDLVGASVAAGDSTSSGFLALQLFRPGVRTRILPADKIAQAVKMGLADCALLPHSDSPACRQSRLHCLTDLGAWWASKTDDLPLPVTCMAIRRDLPDEAARKLEEVIQDSIRFGLSRRGEAIRYALSRAQDMAGGAADGEEGFLGVNVSDLALDMGPTGQKALEELLRRGHEAGVVPQGLPLTFVGGQA